MHKRKTIKVGLVPALAVNVLIGGELEEIRNPLSLKATFITVGDAEVARPHNTENETCEIDFSDKVLENRRLQNAYAEHETPTSTYQGETLNVPEKTENKLSYTHSRVKFEKF